jgi:large subunit ribosomal protein L14e
MLEVGRVCVKTAGRDAMQYGAIVEVVDEKYVIIDGNTRRKKVNKTHVEPTNKTINIKQGASTEEVLREFEKHGLPVKVVSEKKEKTTKVTKSKSDKKSKKE